jgi:hypothetical protein
LAACAGCNLTALLSHTAQGLRNAGSHALTGDTPVYDCRLLHSHQSCSACREALPLCNPKLTQTTPEMRSHGWSQTHSWRAAARDTATHKDCKSQPQPQRADSLSLPTAAHAYTQPHSYLFLSTNTSTDRTLIGLSVRRCPAGCWRPAAPLWQCSSATAPPQQHASKPTKDHMDARDRVTQSAKNTTTHTRR